MPLVLTDLCHSDCDCRCIESMASLLGLDRSYGCKQDDKEHAITATGNEYCLSTFAMTAVTKLNYYSYSGRGGSGG